MLTKLTTQHSVDGSVYQTQYVAPPHKGDHPSAQIEGGKVYTGSCHCGNITVAVMSAPLDKTYAGALECNCSICERVSSSPIHVHT